MEDNKHEKLKHNPERGARGTESDKNKKASKKTEKKSQERKTDAPEERRARFFDTKRDVYEEDKRGLFEARKKEDDTIEPDVKNEGDKNEVKSKELNNEYGVEKDSEGHLTETEARDVASQVAQSRQEQVAEYLAQTKEESVEEAEELAAAAYLTNVERHLGSGEDVTPQMLDKASTETLEDLAYKITDNAEEPDLDADNNGVIDNEDEPELVLNDSVNDEDLQQPQTHSSSAHSHTSHSSSGHSSTGGGGGAPGGPVPGGVYFPPPSLPSLPPHSGFYDRYFSHIPSPSSSLATSAGHEKSHDAEFNYRRKRSKHLLIGGIVGYIIGRRGGRKRTEKRLQPQIDALENEVKILHDEIVQREEKIRLIARKNAEQEAVIKQDNLVDRAEANPAKNKETSDEPAKHLSNQERIKHFVVRQKERLEVQKKHQTTKRMHEEGSIKKMAEVHLAGLNMFVERRKIDGNEDRRKRFEKMNEQELKSHAKDIVVDGVSVVVAYEANRIDTPTLLEVTKRYWRKDSGSYETVFRNNVKPDERELKKYREALEQAHGSKNEYKQQAPETKAQAAADYAKSLADDFYSQDHSNLKTDEERQAYFQRYTNEEMQGSEFGRLLKKAQNGSLLRSKSVRVTFVAVITTAAVLWLILG